MIRNSLRIAAMVGASLAPLAGAAAADWTPNRPVEFVAAAGPGGGTDTFARVVQSALTKDKLLTTAIIVTNKAGGSGAETFIDARSSKGDAYKLFFGTQDAYVLPLANKLSYSLDNLTPIAALAFDPFILWVNPKASGIEDVAGFIAKAKEAPGSVKMGGAKAKEADAALVTLIERAADIKLSYIPYKSGSEAAIQVSGGHIQGNVNNPSESVEQWRGGTQKPLCVFEEERLADTTVIADGQSWNSIPTCKEAGLNVGSFAQPRTVWGAKDMPAEALAFYTDLLKKVAASEEFKAYQQRGAQIPRVLTGDEFKAFIETHEQSYREIYKQAGWLRE
ncbi:tripartite tricarboxylate transporter substrate binding protein [Terrihabitans rhizophilus]|uniref:Tripartite tricarboxylate transporter substrate-binding protein n=1 Tax=Terrihabitans rhizophilus TaxID=3092662 RepID=A0ABU4RJ68_9HYPH|nr:tripartite tricarboxylate transporter substrate-binding protein [Terrihabitans sp. PJ23]MDX6804889.1 tripartite tricarboxylate transporter substrate-binding protein [Terrihabitans sp. PJ23]